mmetsp:Transcript_5293/g.16699  ORF Transcript_5293/g.16699 Transcript_5293/m.16699 type:complete len:235 (+) Transcript_5293:1466-2170(+)
MSRWPRWSRVSPPPPLRGPRATRETPTPTRFVSKSASRTTSAPARRGARSARTTKRSGPKRSARRNFVVTTQRTADATSAIRDAAETAHEPALRGTGARGLGTSRGRRSAHRRRSARHLARWNAAAARRRGRSRSRKHAASATASRWASSTCRACPPTSRRPSRARSPATRSRASWTWSNTKSRSSPTLRTATSSSCAAVDSTRRRRAASSRTPRRTSRRGRRGRRATPRRSST